MKKLFFIILLCFTMLFAAFAMDMSPHPGDSLESILTVQDNVVMSQAVSAPTDENILHFESIYNENEICFLENEEMNGIYYFNPAIQSGMAVLDNGYELGTIYTLTGEVVSIYKTEFG